MDFDSLKSSANYTSAKPFNYKYHKEVKAEPAPRHSQDDSSPEVSRDASQDEEPNSPVFLPPTTMLTPEETDFISRKRKSDNVIDSICNESSFEKPSKAKAQKMHKCKIHPEGMAAIGLFVDRPDPCDVVTCDFYLSPKSKKKFLKESSSTSRKTVIKSILSSNGSNRSTERSNSRQSNLSISPGLDTSSSTPTRKPFSIPSKSFYGDQPRKNLNKSQWGYGLSSDDYYSSPTRASQPLLITEEELDREEAKRRPPIVPRKEKTTANRIVPVKIRSYEIGLPNHGNTCFVNATLQVLLSLDGFTRDLEIACNSDNVVLPLPLCVDLLNQMAVARNAILKDEVHYLLGKYIRRLAELNAEYRGGRQNDANELFVRLLDMTKSSLPEGPTNPVEKHFQHELVQMHLCSLCGATETLPQNSTSICLPITDASSKLEHCLDAYTSSEERSIVCPSCQAPSMTVKNRFSTLPQVLVMSLNRYTNVGKVKKIIAAPLDLHMEQYTTDSSKTAIYSMCAQISHLGESKNSGHYVSHILCTDGNWRRYSDSSHEVLTFEDTQAKHRDPAYIYFYGRIV